MIYTVYFNELSIPNLKSQSQLEDLKNRLYTLANLLKLQTLPDLKFLSHQIYSLQTSDNISLWDFISSLNDRELKNFFSSKLNRASGLDSSSSLQYICELEGKISDTVSFIKDNCIEDKILVSIHNENDQSEVFAKSELDYRIRINWKKQDFFGISQASYSSILHVQPEKMFYFTIPNIGLVDETTVWLRKILDESNNVNNGEDLLNIIDKCKHIKVGVDAIPQIRAITDLTKLRRLKEVILTLEAYADKSWIGAFEYQTIGFSIRPESDFTKQNTQCVKERTLKDHIGNSKFFNLHFNICSERGYIFPDEQNKLIILGYVGKHLTTQKY